MVYREALLYEKLTEGQVRCDLCSHRCKILPSYRGICGVRENRDGLLYSLVYGLVIAEHIDPIEKKPLFHVLPGSKSYSIATVGCNFRCTFCQNHEISQTQPHKGIIPGREATPEEIVRRALDSGCETIAYTYTEPTVYFEFAYDCCRLAHEKNIKNVFVSNGYMTKQAIDMVAPHLDAANIDLKAYTEGFYKRECGASLKPVLDNLRYMKERGIWLEITTLIIPTLNDDPEKIKLLAEFIGTLGAETPWHLSRFHPCYEMTNIGPTPVSTIHSAVQLAKEAGLRYVYSGNIPGDMGEKTHCHHCGQLLIDRLGYQIRENHLQQGCCPRCKTPMAGVLS
ncbi:MAG: AmmeMemoRadiSam system radical SAM enzyme [Deltaproteobacteria bacterium]|nr:AmmeMemoRadiSam system radical SAM enzyme [Deltaproteobacteria bacterium]